MTRAESSYLAALSEWERAKAASLAEPEDEALRIGADLLWMAFICVAMEGVRQ